MTTTIHHLGTVLKLVNVDMDGFNGREHHPTPADLGFEGCVVGNAVMLLDGEGCLLERLVDVPGGSTFTNAEPVCYVVRSLQGDRLLELMEHEVEIVST